MAEFTNTAMTPEEKAKLRGITTVMEWNTFCDELRAARGGQYPIDFHSTCKETMATVEALSMIF
jgi:hypothetical protein